MEEKKREAHDNRKTEANTENLEKIMEEALKGIMDEANENEEKDKKNLADSKVSFEGLDSETAADKDRASEKKAGADEADLKVEAGDGIAREKKPVKKRRKKVKKSADTGDEWKLEAEDGEELEPELDEKDGEELEPQLDAEDGEAFEEDVFEEEEDVLTEEEKAERSKKWKKVVGIVFGSILGTAAAVYLGFAIFFMSHFQFYTQINGVDFGLKPIKDVEAYMSEQVRGYSLTLNESDGGVEKINGADIALVYKPGDELKKLLKEQNAFLWIRSLWEVPEITASIGVEYDEAALSSVLAGLDCMKEENQKEPVSAKPDFNGTEFVVKAEETGSKIEPAVFEQKVAEHIQGFRDTMDMTAEECYVKPKYNSESKEVAEACTTMNEYLKANITYTFGNNEEKVDAEVISGWLKADEDMKVTFDNNAVKEYINTLASKYNTYQTKRTFTSGNGNTVSVQGGDYGCIIDKDKEYNALIANIEKREVVKREPAYKRKAASHGGVDWGSTYVEVDLSRQYMYLFVNGAVVTSGPIVTGKPSTGSATPQGVYYIKYCARNATLRGPKQPDGSYEWESPVSFWMPFNGGIGLHDAPWQAAFGGSRYLTHGSHGCVNLQYNVAKTVFANVTAGTPVVCHY